MAGTLTIDTLKASSGVLATQNGMTGIAKAWVNFDGVTTTTINSSFNVSSVTRNSTGDYTVNFTTAMANANYSIVAMAANSNLGQANTPSLKYGNGTQNGGTSPSLKSTTQVEFVIGIGNSTTYYDSYGINVVVLGS